MAGLTDDPPRVVLFGRTGAGKSSLLGALVQAAKTQGDRLGAEIVDPSGTLEPLREQAYSEASLHPATAEVTAHALRLRPWHAGAKEPSEPGPVLVLDSAGPAAEALLKSPEALSSASPLAKELNSADALLLAVPATADEAELAESFQEFQGFLDEVWDCREWDRSVGGLPVAIVLTKCDRLAQPGDTPERWQERIDERKAHVADRFRDFLEDSRGANHLPFGSIDLKIYATAIRSPESAAEPFGVAALFRDSFGAARQHRDRSRQSRRRLGWMVRAASVLVTVLVAALVALFSRHPDDGSATLADHIRSFQHREGEASVRLAAKNLNRNQQTLQAFRDDSAFDALPPDLQQYVKVRLREIEDYQSFRTKLLDGPSPSQVRSLEELQRIEARLASLPLPEEYAWGETEAAKLRATWTADVPAIREAVRSWENWYRDLIRQEMAFERTDSFSGAWRPDVMTFLKRAQELPFKLGDTIPGSSVTYAVPFEFDRVFQARKDWEFTRDRLVDLRDLAEALGLCSGVTIRPAVLDLPEARPGSVEFTYNAMQRRLATLRDDYPSTNLEYPQWVITRFAEPVRRELSQRVQRSFDRGVEQVRFSRLNVPGSDTPKGWRALAERLEPPLPASSGDTPMYQDWSRILTLLARLTDPKAADPFEELRQFLLQPEFEIRLGTFDVIVPDDLLLQRPVPKGDLTITHGERVYSLQQVGPGERKGGETTYRFTLTGDSVLKYKPGDSLSAALTLRGGEEELNLTWSDSRCQTYAFEALSRPARGVRLVPGAGTQIPALPVLLPDLRK